MDKINKSLAEIPKSQRRKIIEALQKLNKNELAGLDIKKLRGSNNIFRVRVGSYRIIFKRVSPEKYIVITVSKRDEKTYRNY